jgi:ketosteroid isomerase-like protein
MQAIEALAGWRFEAFQNAPTPAARADAYVGGVAEDAVWMPPHASLVRGRSAIREWAEEFFSNWELEIATSTDVTTSLSEDLAVRRWTSMGTFVPYAGGDPVPFHQKFIEVLSKQPDGSWLISMRMWNSNNDEPDIWH